MISVGSTNNVNPLVDTPPGCATDSGSSNPEVVSDFSCLGAWFGPLPAATRLHQVRIKPDLVAPGRRVVGTRPYERVPTEIGEYQDGVRRAHRRARPGGLCIRSVRVRRVRPRPSQVPEDCGLPPSVVDQVNNVEAVFNLVTTGSR